MCARGPRQLGASAGRGGGGAGECIWLARAREGLSSPNPHLDPSPSLRVSPALPRQPSLSLPTSRPPTFLCAPPARLPPRPTAALGYCFRVRVTSGVREARPGASPACSPCYGSLTRGTRACEAPAQNTPSVEIPFPGGKFASPTCPLSRGLAPLKADFPTVLVPAPRAPTSGNSERST